MNYLNKLINFILAPICKEPVFFGVFAFLFFLALFEHLARKYVRNVNL